MSDEQQFNQHVFNKLTEAEQSLVDWQYGKCGGFYLILWQAIQLADKDNLAKIERGFPKHVEVYRKYKYEKGWWERLQARLVSQPIVLVFDRNKQKDSSS